MKKLIPIILLCIVCTSCSSDQSKQNGKNIKKVEIGMSVSEVNDIMEVKAKPYANYWDTSRFVYVYENSFAASDHYMVFFSAADSTVVSVGYGD